VLALQKGFGFRNVPFKTSAIAIPGIVMRRRHWTMSATGWRWFNFLKPFERFKQQLSQPAFGFGWRFLAARGDEKRPLGDRRKRDRAVL
jgi:hypothetical protein